MPERTIIELKISDGTDLLYDFELFPSGEYGFNYLGNNVDGRRESKVMLYDTKAECASDMAQNIKNQVLVALGQPEEGETLPQESDAVDGDLEIIAPSLTQTAKRMIQTRLSEAHIEDMNPSEKIIFNLEGIKKRIYKIRELLPAVEELVSDCRTRAEVVDVLIDNPDDHEEDENA